MAYRLGEDEEFRHLFINSLRHMSSLHVDNKPIIAIDGQLLITVNSGDMFELIVHEVCCRNIDLETSLEQLENGEDDEGCMTMVPDDFLLENQECSIEPPAAVNIADLTADFLRSRCPTQPDKLFQKQRFRIKNIKLQLSVDPQPSRTVSVPVDEDHENANHANFLAADSVVVKPEMDEKDGDLRQPGDIQDVETDCAETDHDLSSLITVHRLKRSRKRRAENSPETPGDTDVVGVSHHKQYKLRSQTSVPINILDTYGFFNPRKYRNNQKPAISLSERRRQLFEDCQNENSDDQDSVELSVSDPPKSTKMPSKKCAKNSPSSAKSADLNRPRRKYNSSRRSQTYIHISLKEASEFLGRQKCVFKRPEPPLPLSERRKRLFAGNGPSPASPKSKSAKQTSRIKVLHCSSCPNVCFATRSAQAAHRYRFHLPQRCYACSVVLRGRIEFDEHCQKLHPGVSQYELSKKLVCEYCSATFNTNWLLKDHISSRHFGCVYRCDICSKELSTAQTLRLHKKNIHDTDRHRTCEACGQQFARYGAFFRHIRLNHPHLLTDEQRSRIADLVCPHCGLELATRPALEQHVTVKHRGGEQLECEFCKRIYACRKYLRQHIRIHHSVKS